MKKDSKSYQHPVFRNSLQTNILKVDFFFDDYTGKHICIAYARVIGEIEEIVKLQQHLLRTL